jgi:hypothetical protein
MSNQKIRTANTFHETKNTPPGRHIVILSTLDFHKQTPTYMTQSCSESKQCYNPKDRPRYLHCRENIEYVTAFVNNAISAYYILLNDVTVASPKLIRGDEKGYVTWSSFLRSYEGTVLYNILTEFSIPTELSPTT